MTATAIQCPKCRGDMWDQKAGKYPWKPGTPVYKCKNKECAANGGVIWETREQTAERSGGGGNGGAVAAPRAASAAPQSQPVAPNGHELYGKITAWVLREIVPMYEAGGVPMNAEAAAACVATLYIQATRNGH